ncbi:hypothetical protein HNQ60_002658 [Povalibacter uvarum]|uniref:DUF3034 family protein n=1 Tax=Povalibacter uvarum TaxID=732238 RepID=A0A841HL37_9GAMM|nr:DUF3034 family protein [Povalibacter uvarum]MBB6093777.1 hypothetical protein [Povalibacter uvarum]
MSAAKRVGFLGAAVGLGLLSASGAALAGDRLLATGGVTQIEGAAGGGLSPWALIAGLGTRDQIGGSGFCTSVEPDDFELMSCGLSVGIHDRVELSYARQKFDLGTTVPGESIRQDVFGVKVKVFGDAVFAQDSPWPQIAVGAQFKRNKDFDFVPTLLGARDGEDIDYYVAATKIWLSGAAGRTTLLNGTLRATRANQFGILGFGGDLEDGYTLQPELSTAIFLTDHIVAGAEYRMKPDNLSVFREDDSWDAFVAFIPFKNVSLTLAHVDLGNIADKDDQRGWYASLQASF